MCYFLFLSNWAKFRPRNGFLGSTNQLFLWNLLLECGCLQGRLSQSGTMGMWVPARKAQSVRDHAFSSIKTYKWHFKQTWALSVISLEGNLVNMCWRTCFGFPGFVTKLLLPLVPGGFVLCTYNWQDFRLPFFDICSNSHQLQLHNETDL